MAGGKYVSTDEEKLIIESYKNNKLSYEQIGKLFNRTGAMVGIIIRRNGIPNNGAKFKDKEFIIPKHKFRKLQYIAERKNRKFDLTIEYLSDLFRKQNSRCIYSNMVLTFGDTNYRYLGTASLDRIDSDIDYIQGNVQWIHKDINMMKQKFTHNEFLKWCKIITENAQKSTE